jgi:2,5-dihydroxypyridine 5,6-dioxygenase
MHETLNHAKLAMLFRKELELCNVRNGETIVLLSDLGARRDYVSAAFAAAEEFGADAYEMCVNAMPSWTKVGVETIGRCKERSRRSKQPICWSASTFRYLRAG